MMSQRGIDQTQAQTSSSTSSSVTVRQSLSPAAASQPIAINRCTAPHSVRTGYQQQRLQCAAAADHGT